MRKISKKLLGKYVEVIWKDACGWLAGTWYEEREMEDFTLSTITEVGILRRIDKDGIVLVSGQSSSGTVSGAGIIPIVGIKSIKEIK
jgi:hypothetical protein